MALAALAMALAVAAARHALAGALDERGVIRWLALAALVVTGHRQLFRRPAALRRLPGPRGPAAAAPAQLASPGGIVHHPLLPRPLTPDRSAMHASFPASSRPASPRSATISAPSATGWRCRTATSASTAWSICTRSPVWQDPAAAGRGRRARWRRCCSPAASIPNAAHPVRAVARARACAAGLDLQLRRPHRLAQPHDAVQGQGRQGPGERSRPGCTSIRT